LNGSSALEIVASSAIVTPSFQITLPALQIPLEPSWVGQAFA
jgi:hypothetical protein